MSFHHLAGVTTPGAPDLVIDWFATFEAWITATVGWTIASGAGTTDLVIRSEGEAGGMTMLFVHVWRDLAFPNNVQVEVQDDAGGTHATTSGALLISGGVQFNFWMSADMDAMAMVWQQPGGWRYVYAGLIMPFALSVIDETYRMMAGTSVNNATILRRWDHAWDQNSNLYRNDYIMNARVDRDDGSLPLGGTYFGFFDDIAGQLKHVSCRITDPATPVLSALTTGPAGQQTTWIVLQDNGGLKFAMRTGGVAPTGREIRPPAYVTWTPASVTAFFAGLSAFLTGLGYSVLDLTPLTGLPWDREYHSTGESGAEDVWIRGWCPGPAGAISLCVADSTFGTPGRHETCRQPGVSEANFPAVIHLAGDRDAVVVCMQHPGNEYAGVYLGVVEPAALSLSSTYMRVVAFGGPGGIWPAGQILLAHDGLWGQPVNAAWQGDGAHSRISQPNTYDGETYLVWPFLISETLDGEIIGFPKFMYATDGGGVAQGDYIRCGDTDFLVFIEAGIRTWALRTPITGVGVIHPGAHLRGFSIRLDEGV